MASLGASIHRWRSHTPIAAGLALADGLPPATFGELVEAVRTALLEDIYCDEEGGTHERTWHEDVESMTALQLADERARLRLRLLMDRQPSEWLGERLARLNDRARAEAVRG